MISSTSLCHPRSCRTMSRTAPRGVDGRNGAASQAGANRITISTVCLTRSSLELALARPPETQEEALVFAWEYASYCADGLSLYDAEETTELAACLISADVVRFWWD
jgi:Domain of unknown function (DUF4253)